MLNIIISVFTGIALVGVFFYICSKLDNFTTGLCLLLLVILSCTLSFLNIKREIVFRVSDQTIKIINISYHCPDCNNYINSLETKYCPRCGKKLDYVKKSVRGEK